jgi:hypothetical protein
MPFSSMENYTGLAAGPRSAPSRAGAVASAVDKFPYRMFMLQIENISKREISCAAAIVAMVKGEAECGS